MHENLALVPPWHTMSMAGRLYRRTGRTTRGLLLYLEPFIRTPSNKTRTVRVLSPYGNHASAMLVSRCGDMLNLLEEFTLRVEVGPGYHDHNDHQPPSLLHAEDGVSHAWNTAPVVTCLECLAVI